MTAAVPQIRWRGQQGPDGARLWTCDGCDATAPWAAGWAWFGNYHVSRLGEREAIQRVLCAACATREGVKPL